jgi:hypothetical protein
MLVNQEESWSWLNIDFRVLLKNFEDIVPRKKSV